jgi:hypothetical protein
MDLSRKGPGLTDADTSEDARDKAVTARSVNLLEYPQEIQRMIFQEALSKPTIHYATFDLRRSIFLPLGHNHVHNGCAMLLTRWSDGDLRSGYVTNNTLKNTCFLARETVRGAMIEPTQINYVDGCEVVDAKTDLLCLVFPELEGDVFLEKFDTADRGPVWWPPLDQAQITATVGDISHAGVLVCTELWWWRLDHWFNFHSCDCTYRDSTGHLQSTRLGALMTCFRQLTTFSMILTEVTENEWNAYYSSKYNYGRVPNSIIIIIIIGFKLTVRPCLRSARVPRCLP